MSHEEYGFRQVVDDVYICVADADTRAVMGAKTSRAPNLEKRWQELMDSNDGKQWPWGDPPDSVKQFLDKYLKEYMHSSIAEMAEVFVHCRGLGWPTAWLIEDNPLFVGQEVSTRAVDVLGDSKEPCKNADPRLESLHYEWVELFETLKDQSGDSGYKFDEIRWALPGTTRSGVTMCNKVRDGVRQLEKIAGMGDGYEELTKPMMEGFKAYAPRAVSAVDRGPRNPSSMWSPKVAKIPLTLGDEKRKNNCVKVRSKVSVRTDIPGEDVSRDGPGEYLDDSWHFYGPMEFEVTCSVAAARDWHRHRSVMPWEVSVVLDEETNKLVKSPFYDMSSVDDSLWNRTDYVFHEILNDKNTPDWSALYALPFGATVRLRCHATLPYLMYMLELRYSSSGSNYEYKEQAAQGIYHLSHQLGPSITQREHILGILDDDDLRRWRRIKCYI